MDKTQKIIVVLLIISILFSAVSIVINLSVSNISIDNKTSGSVLDRGDRGSVSLFVEENRERGEG